MRGFRGAIADTRKSAPDVSGTPRTICRFIHGVLTGVIRPLQAVWVTVRFSHCSLAEDGGVSPWIAHVRRADEMPAQADIPAGGRAWRDAYGVALGALGSLLVVLAFGALATAAGPVAPLPVHIAALAAGADFSCALLGDGTVRCWGGDERGQLGRAIGNPWVPVPVSGVADAIAIAAGSSHACALRARGAMQCWGANFAGQVGMGEITVPSPPKGVIGVLDAVAIAAGGSHSCALLGDRTVRCWGANASGELGDGTFNQSARPVPVAGLTLAVGIAAGAAHACALLADGTVRCWGANASGQLGNGTLENASRPVAVPDIATATGIAAGAFHTCALLAEGRVRCWGANDSGQLGNGVNLLRALTPVTMAGITIARAVAGGLAHTCVLLAAGAVWCTGANEAGQLGNGILPDPLFGDESPDPLPVRGITAATAIAAGGAHTCALLADGTVRCWGANEAGQLGQAIAVSSSTLQPVAGLR